jgi:hypothetical protein
MLPSPGHLDPLNFIFLIFKVSNTWLEKMMTGQNPIYILSMDASYMAVTAFTYRDGG